MDTKKRILLVDDEQINLEFFEVMLTKLGFETEKSDNGADALELVKRFKPDLIILDNVMPRLSGWEVTKIIKTSEELPRVRRYSDNHVLRDGRRKGQSRRARAGRRRLHHQALQFFRSAGPDQGRAADERAHPSDRAPRGAYPHFRRDRATRLGFAAGLRAPLVELVSDAEALEPECGIGEAFCRTYQGGRRTAP